MQASARAAACLRAAFGRLGRTFREIRQYRQAFLLFLAMLLYQDGIQTIIRMASVYGAEIGIDQNAQIAAFVMVQFLGIPFSFLFGSLGARIGTKRALFVALAVYTMTSILGFFLTTVVHFFILAALVATVQGGAQALSRAMFSRLIPVEQGVGVLRVLRGGRAVRHRARSAGLHVERRDHRIEPLRRAVHHRLLRCRRAAPVTRRRTSR